MAIRGGLNFDHPSFIALMQGICERRLQFIVIAHRERLARTAFNLINTLCRLHGVEIIVTESEGDVDPQQELVSDLLAITHYYSTRLYASRAIKTNSIALPDDVVRQIVELHAAGHSQNVIFDSLKQAGKNKGEDGREFSIHVVRRVIKRHAKLAPVLARSTHSHASPAFALPRHGKPCSFQTFWQENVRLGSPAAKLSRTTLIQTYRRWAAGKGVAHVNTPKEITKWMKCRQSHLLKFHTAARKAGEEIVYTGLWIGEVDA